MVKWDPKRADRLCELGLSERRTNNRPDYCQVDENQTTGKVSLGLSVIVRVTLRDGTFHEVRNSES